MVGRESSSTTTWYFVGMSPHAALRVLVGSLLLLVVACAVRWSLAATSTTGPFLPTAPCGEWQRAAWPFNPIARDAKAEVRDRFRLSADVTVWTNGAIDAATTATVTEASFGPRMTGTTFRATTPVTFDIVTRGLPPVLAVCPAGVVVEALVGDAWRPLASVATEPISQIGLEFPSVFTGLQRVWPWLLVCWVLLAAGFSYAAPRWTLSHRHSVLLLCAMAAVVGVNNLLHIQGWYGYDYKGHLNYIEIIATESRLPFAGEDWETYQSPLYYLLSSFGYRLCETLDLAPQSYIISARVVPAVASVLQIVVTALAARACFEDATRRHLSVVLMAALPMILVSGQMPSNEALTGLLGGAVSVFSMYAITRDITNRQAVLGGVIFGLSLLTKVSAVLLALPLVLAFACRGRAGIRPLLIVLSSAFVVCGWYYIRNLLELGALFKGNWSYGFSWSQDPGVRVPAHFYRFGETFVSPFFSGVTSIWDGIYSTLWSDAQLGGKTNRLSAPRWNYDLVVAVVGLSVFPTMAMLFAPVTFWSQANRRRVLPLMIALITVFVCMAAIVDYAVKLPIYSAAKATYAGSAAPALCILGVAGLGPLLEVKPLRPWIMAALVVFAGCVQVAYFAGSPN